MTFRSAVGLALCAVTLGFLGFSPSRAFGTTATTTFGVSATVLATCTVSATAMAFGNYSGVLITGTTSTITVTCTNTTTYNVGLSAGLSTGATVTTRKMVNGAALLGYSLYRDSGLTQNWGVTIGTDTASGTGNGAAQPITVYGQVPAGQYVTPGSYADTITATVTY